MKGESLLLSGIGVVVVRRCRLCVPDSPGGASRFVCDIHNKDHHNVANLIPQKAILLQQSHMVTDGVTHTQTSHAGQNVTAYFYILFSVTSQSRYDLRTSRTPSATRSLRPALTHVRTYVRVVSNSSDLFCEKDGQVAMLRLCLLNETVNDAGRPSAATPGCGNRRG